VVGGVGRGGGGGKKGVVDCERWKKRWEDSGGIGREGGKSGGDKYGEIEVGGEGKMRGEKGKEKGGGGGGRISGAEVGAAGGSEGDGRR